MAEHVAIGGPRVARGAKPISRAARGGVAAEQLRFRLVSEVVSGREAVEDLLIANLVDVNSRENLRRRLPRRS